MAAWQSDQSMKGDLAIRHGPRKLVFLANGRKKELYHVQNDRGETQDGAAAQPEVVARLTGLMQRYIDAGCSTPGAPHKNGITVSLTGKRKKGRAEPE